MTEKQSQFQSHYPTTCGELLHASTASYLVAAFQLVLITGVALIYVVMEHKEYFTNTYCFRPVIFCITVIYAGGAIATMIGVATRRSNLVSVHVTLMIALMVFTDMVAVSIIIIMAIGNRNTFIYTLPAYFVDEKRFYDVLGPFWMYLGAITLHITVAINMCFLQTYNAFIAFLKDPISMDSSAQQNKEPNNN